MRDLNLEEDQSKSDEWHQVLFLGDGRDVLNDAVQNITGECTRCQPVVLGRFYDWLKFLLDGIGDFGGKLDIAFQKIGQELVRLF